MRRTLQRFLKHKGQVISQNDSEDFSEGLSEGRRIFLNEQYEYPVVSQKDSEECSVGLSKGFRRFLSEQY